MRQKETNKDAHAQFILYSEPLLQYCTQEAHWDTFFVINHSDRPFVVTQQLCAGEHCSTVPDYKHMSTILHSCMCIWDHGGAGVDLA